jgi:hypothetical protein
MTSPSWEEAEVSMRLVVTQDVARASSCFEELSGSPFVRKPLK